MSKVSVEGECRRTAQVKVGKGRSAKVPLKLSERVSDLNAVTGLGI